MYQLLRSSERWSKMMFGGLGKLVDAATKIPGLDKIPGANTVINGAKALKDVAQGDFGGALANATKGLPVVGNAIAMADSVTGGKLTDFIGDKANGLIGDKLNKAFGGKDLSSVSDDELASYFDGMSDKDLIASAASLGMDPDKLMQGDFRGLGYDDSSFGDFINTGRFSNPSSSSWLGDDDDFGPGSFNGRAGMNGNNLADLYSDEDLGVGGFGNNGGMQSTGNPDLDAIVNAKNPARALAGLDDADRAQLMSSLNPQQSAALRNAVNNGPGADHSLDGLFDGMGIEQRGAAAQAKLEEISAGLEGLGADKTSELMRDKLGKLIEKTFDQAEFDIIASYLQMYQNLLNMLLGKDRAHAEGTVQKYGR